MRLRLPLRVIDAHDLTPWRTLYPDLITPDEAEATALLRDGATVPTGPARAEFFAGHRRELLRTSGATIVAVTLDRDGVLLLDGDKPAFRTHTHPARPENCAGAGDTFTAAMTIGLVRGMSSAEATQYGQLAADIATAQPGTSVCTAPEVERRVDATAGPLISHGELARRITDHRLAGRRIVFTNGCFDVLHRGHVAYLTEAKAEGALSCVDYVTAFDGDTPEPLLLRLQPDVYAKGGDYTVDMLTEASVVQSYGGDVRILGYVADHSTTDTIARIRSVNPPDNITAERA